MLLKKRHVNFRWYILGEGNERANLEKLLRLNGLSEFILLGRTENPYPYIKACDLYVQSSRHEGYPIAQLERETIDFSDEIKKFESL